MDNSRGSSKFSFLLSSALGYSFLPFLRPQTAAAEWPVVFEGFGTTRGTTWPADSHMLIDPGMVSATCFLTLTFAKAADVSSRNRRLCDLAVFRSGRCPRLVRSFWNFVSGLFFNVSFASIPNVRFTPLANDPGFYSFPVSKSSYCYLNS